MVSVSNVVIWAVGEDTSQRGAKRTSIGYITKATNRR